MSPGSPRRTCSLSYPCAPLRGNAETDITTGSRYVPEQALPPASALAG